MKLLRALVFAAAFAALFAILTACKPVRMPAVSEPIETTVLTTESLTEPVVPTIRLFGVEYSPDITELKLKTIPSYDELLSALSEFPLLTSVDLGEYELNVKQMQEFHDKYPDTTLQCIAYTETFNRKVYLDATELNTDDFSSEEFRAVAQLLPNLTTVRSETKIPLDEKEQLLRDYPDITFQITGTLDVFGVTVDDTEETLDLTDAAVDHTLPDMLKMLPALKTVILYGSGLNIEIQYALCKQFPDIEFRWTVDVAGQTYDGDAEELDLSGTDVTFDTLLKVLTIMKHLKHLDASDCAATNGELALLKDLFPNVKLVWKIYMGKWSLKTDVTAFSVLIMRFDYTRMTSEDIEVLKYCTDLQALDIGHQAITDVSVIGDYLPNLRVLILADNSISDITPLAKLKHLHYVELFMNPVQDISPLGECKELVDINVSWTKTNSAAGILELPLLERLWIQHTYTPGKDIQTLRDTYPNATVMTAGEGSTDQGWRTHARYYAMKDMYNKQNYISEQFTKYDSDGL